MKRIFIIIIVFFNLISLTSCKNSEGLAAKNNFSINDTLNFGNNEKVRVILLYGQSNATGCTNNSYLKEKDSKTYDKASNGIDNVYINYFCENGGNSSNGEFVLCSLGCGVTKEHFGPEVGIALKYKEEGLKCFIIKYTWGGTILDNQWLNGKYNRGELYKAAINFTKTSLNYLIKKGYNLQIDGICWMQGEGDSIGKLSSRYYKNTKRFIQYLRNDLSIYQNTIDFIDAGISDSILWTEYKLINDAKEKNSNEDEHNYFINTIEYGLHVDQEPVNNVDLAHYDSESEILLGILFGEFAINKKL